MRKVFIETLGCKVNQYESSAIQDNLIKQGYESVNEINKADILIINTCTVTNRTDFKSRNLIRRALDFKKVDNNKLVIVTGCYAQREKDQALGLGEIDAIVDNNSKDKIPEIINELYKAKNLFKKDLYFHEMEDFEGFTELPSSTMSDKSRVFIKIQDGCNFYCAYCAVPFARGLPRSRDPRSIITQIKEMFDKGYREFVLAGINQGLYGIDFDYQYDLADLIQEICDIPRTKQIRLSSIEPQLITEKLMDVICRNKQVCPHLHIPLQSGSDSLLKAMGRKYDTTYFRQLITSFLERRPDIAFGFDVIVGLPGETDELFEETYRFLSEISFTYLHVFVYSKRSGTRAAGMPGQVHGTISKRRSQSLINLSKEKTSSYIEKLVEEKQNLLMVIEGNEDGNYYGTSDHYIKCYFKAENHERGNLCLIEANKAHKDYILGSFIKEEV